MTVQAEVTKVSYDCDGSTTEFSITFKCFSTDDIVVIHVEDGVETVLTETTHYSISGNLDTGGKVTTVSTYDSGVKIIIMLDIDLDQETDLPYGGSYTSVSVETMADKLTKICQQLSEKLGRALTFKASSSEEDVEIDDLVANKALVVNSSGDGIEMGPSIDEINSAQTYAEAASTAQTAAETAQRLSEDAKDLAQAAQVAAAASAAGVNLPAIEDGDADKILQVLDDETGYELVTPPFAASGVNADITSMTGLDDDGIPFSKIAGAGIFGAYNLKPAVNASANKLDIFSKSGGAAPDASNPIKVMIPDGTGYTQRTRAAAYLSGTSQIIMADAGGYWGRSSLADEIKTAWLYAIWDGTGIVWALGGYSGFNTVPTTTTAGDDDYFLLEDGSTYTRNASHYCVAVAKIRYEYNTADDPDHTIQAAAVNAPQVIWNPKSDYSSVETLATGVSSGSDIADASVVSTVVKQSGRYRISAQLNGYSIGAGAQIKATIKTGSSTYGSASIKSQTETTTSGAGADGSLSISTQAYLNAGDTIHLGGSVASASGTRGILGDNTKPYTTLFEFGRID